MGLPWFFPRDWTHWPCQLPSEHGEQPWHQKWSASGNWRWRMIYSKKNRKFAMENVEKKTKNSWKRGEFIWVYHWQLVKKYPTSEMLIFQHQSWVKKNPSPEKWGESSRSWPYPHDTSALWIQLWGYEHMIKYDHIISPVISPTFTEGYDILLFIYCSIFYISKFKIIAA